MPLPARLGEFDPVPTIQSLHPENVSAATDAAGLKPFIIALLASAVLYGGIILRQPMHVQFGLIFNDMLLHMLKGRFDVNPAIVGFEGFVRDGRTYSYFGPFAALVRLLALPFCNLRTTDLTPLFCWFAAVATLFCDLMSLRLIWRASPSSPTRTCLTIALVLSLALGGPTLPFLKPSIYQEVTDWAALWASAFVFLVLGGLLSPRRFALSRVGLMAMVSGLCLLARVSTAIGLYGALLLLATSTHFYETEDDGTGRPGFPRRVGPTLVLFSRKVWLAGFILLSFALVVGFVNFERWGNPLTFANFNIYNVNLLAPDWTVRLHRYGEFNLSRLPYGLIYYFLPVWAVPSGGGLLFGQQFSRLLDMAGLPPASFLLSDPLLICLTASLVLALARRNAGAVLAGPIVRLLVALAIPGFLMLIAIAMAFRYRVEFYPLFEFAAFLEMRRLCAGSGLNLTRRRLVLLLAVVGILFSQVELFTYTLSPMGPVHSSAFWHLYGEKL